ncbi:suppression of tumorigenicity 5 protein-like [Chanos chanos]|uniref:Suppression of tumorigenicity 5 protein-like n=1 Tax=Chanos chanos TaxID=29144 RepID=A0A6J2W9U7_CHACN|nr:suppression of tumorigenicity 5 protein-like [Chanos chanos]
MTANKSDKNTVHCCGKGARDALEKCQTVSLPPPAPAAKVSSYSVSDSEDLCQQRQNNQPIGEDMSFQCKSRTSDCHSLRLLRTRGIGRLDNRLSVFKPVRGDSKGQKENQSEGMLQGDRQSTVEPLSCEILSHSSLPPKLYLSRPSSLSEHHHSEPGPVDLNRGIPRWDYCRVELPRMSLYVEKKALGERVGGSEGCPSLLSSPCSEKTFEFQDKCKMNTTFSDCSYPGTEDEAGLETCRFTGNFAKRPSQREAQALLLRSLAGRSEGSVLSRVQKIEQALKNCPSQPPQFPSSCYAPKKNPGIPVQIGKHHTSECKVMNSFSGTSKVDESKPRQRSHSGVTRLKSSELTSLDVLGDTLVNPIPKPKRTFEYEANRSYDKTLSSSNSLSPKNLYEGQPLMTSTPAGQKTRSQKAVCRFYREDATIPCATQLNSAKEHSSVTKGIHHDPCFKRSAEENTYEDILGKYTVRDDVERNLISGYTVIEMLVQRISAIFRSKRGKKRLKKLSRSSTETSSNRDGKSESESDSDDRLNVNTQRLLRLQSLLRHTPSYRTLELQMLHWQEKRELFEHFVVVSLKKRPPKSSYTPEISYQFPKLERLTKQMREAEQRLKAIPQFCFPDAKDWIPVIEYSSETFSFVLTGDDGGRRFGYCRRLLPSGTGPRLPEVYCVISRLGCFDLFSKILDEVEKRLRISAALVYPFMRCIMESPFPAPGKTIKVKTFLPGAGKEELELRRPADSRLEHVDLRSLFSCLSVPQVVRVFASLLLERRVIFVADKLSTLSSCAHAVLALLYPFSWQHTFIPVLPASMLDMVCCPTPFLVGLLSSSLPRLQQLPLEETLMVDLRTDCFIRQMDDEATLLPRKLQAALEQALEQRDDIINQDSDSESEDDATSLNNVVSEVFIRFFLETVGHYPLFMTQNASGERFFQKEAFRKAVVSRSVRHFLGIFMESQMFAGFIQDQELRKTRTKGLFEVRVEQYLEELPDADRGGVNRFLRGLGSKMKFLQKKS